MKCGFHQTLRDSVETWNPILKSFQKRTIWEQKFCRWRNGFRVLKNRADRDTDKMPDTVQQKGEQIVHTFIAKRDKSHSSHFAWPCILLFCKSRSREIHALISWTSSMPNTDAFVLLGLLLARLIRFSGVTTWTVTPNWRSRAVYLSSKSATPDCR